MSEAGHSRLGSEAGSYIFLYVMADPIDGRELYRTLVTKARVGLCVPKNEHSVRYRDARLTTLRTLKALRAIPGDDDPCKSNTLFPVF